MKSTQMRTWHLVYGTEMLSVFIINFISHVSAIYLVCLDCAFPIGLFYKVLNQSLNYLCVSCSTLQWSFRRTYIHWFIKLKLTWHLINTKLCQAMVIQKNQDIVLALWEVPVYWGWQRCGWILDDTTSCTVTRWCEYRSGRVYRVQQELRERVPRARSESGKISLQRGLLGQV